MWRPIAMALLAANLLFLAWTIWIADDGGHLAAPPGVAAQGASASIAAASPPEPPPAARCVSLGPFADPAQAATVAQRLAAASLASVAREERRELRDGWWVFVLAGDAANQRRTIQRIRQAGVQDAWSMPDDPTYRISLGIFSERARAEQRAGRLRPLGLTPQVEEHFQEQQLHWLDVPGAGDRLSASQLEGFGIVDSEVGAFDCPGPSAETAAPPPAAPPAPAQGEAPVPGPPQP